jgi:hypothetical protein
MSLRCSWVGLGSAEKEGRDGMGGDWMSWNWSRETGIAGLAVVVILYLHEFKMGKGGHSYKVPSAVQ